MPGSKIDRERHPRVEKQQAWRAATHFDGSATRMRISLTATCGNWLLFATFYGCFVVDA